ncbi:hypothetical protein O3G_MSEX000099 [Manduca sexta]|nr:hypothetical protein O3G_MSEX000099 [Manduca sexta]
MEYPYIHRRNTTSDTCAVTIGPIERWMLGNWTLYGQFRSVLWFNEARLPMTMFLYDEENPFAQPYNVTNLEPFNRVINLNTTVTVEVTGTGSIDSCVYRAPSGQVYGFQASEQFPGVEIVNVDNNILCRMSIGPIKENMLGEWQIIGKFSRNGIFTERRQIFNIIREDPDNPIIEDRVVQNLTERVFDTKIGTNHTISIFRSTFVNPQSCHIRTPAGRQYTIMDGFNLPGVTVVTGSEVVCGVTIEVFSEDMIGEWVLISRATMSSDAIERRQPFVIYVEEQVEAFPRELVITEGNDLYVRLREPTDQYDTCSLIGPKENSTSDHDIDVIHNKSCGFVVKTVRMSDEGTWEIVYGARIVYRARIKVSVVARKVSQMSNMTLNLDREVNKEIGPEDAVYCKLIDPKGFSVFDGFGRCKLAIERVTMDLSGYWKMLVGIPGRVLVETQEFMVTVVEAEPKAVVSTKVERERPSVMLSCSVSSQHNVSACKFRDPSGTILLANQGVGEDRYVFHGSEVSVTAEVHSHVCGLRITNPTVNDLGLWRCGMETEGDTYFGFLSVVCPWLMQDPEVQATVVTEPTLTPDRSNITAVEGETVRMSCSVQSAIRYCYFRNSNGTVFSIKPATSTSSMEYVGSGFDAGECGVRFTNLVARNSGNWSCHVGLVNQTVEQRARFQVNIQEPMTVRHYMHQGHGLVVEARVHSERHLEYCRFVRIDGTGFSTDSIPAGYNFIGSLDSGHCLLQIEEASTLNLRRWTVAVKIRGQELELSRQTTESLRWVQRPRGFSTIYFWVVITLMFLSFVMLGLTFGPKKNRQWTYERAARVRNSLRNSFRKQRRIENA